MSIFMPRSLDHTLIQVLYSWFSVSRSRLSYECAVLLNCNKIFTSECATDVAVQLLSDTTLGRCSHITYDTVS